MNLLHATASKCRFSCQREPERFAQRVDVGAHVERRMFELFRAGECRRAHESVMGQRLRIDLSGNALARPKSIIFTSTFVLLVMCVLSIGRNEHQVRWL